MGVVAGTVSGLYASSALPRVFGLGVGVGVGCLPAHVTRPRSQSSVTQKGKAMDEDEIMFSIVFAAILGGAILLAILAAIAEHFS